MESRLPWRSSFEHQVYQILFERQIPGLRRAGAVSFSGDRSEGVMGKTKFEREKVKNGGPFPAASPGATGRTRNSVRDFSDRDLLMPKSTALRLSRYSLVRSLTNPGRSRRMRR